MLTRLKRAHLRRPWLAVLTITLALAAVISAWLLLDTPSAPLKQLPQYNSFLGASEFVVGENRFPFALASMEGEPLADADISVSFFYLQDTEWRYRFRRDTEYREVEGVTPHLHDEGFVHNHQDVRGQYLARVNFQSPGVWQARFALANDDAPGPAVGDLAFNVLPDPSAPGVGEAAPPIQNLTVRDVSSIQEIESREPPDNMHSLSVAQALQEEKPFVLVWSAPMFCTSAICGPVLDAAVRVQERFGDRVNFIHIEPWDLETARNQGRLVPVPAFLEWGLTTEPWVFVINAQGRIHDRFEGLITDEDLEQALTDLLLSSS